MKRRDFVRVVAGGVTAGAFGEAMVSAQVVRQPSARPDAAAAKAKMKAGTQHGDSDAILRVLAGFGVNHICSRLPSARMDTAWSVEGLLRLRERVESFGLTLDMVPLPLSSNKISRSENPAILLARDPQRDRQIDDICQMIRNAARAGIPSVKYNLTFLGVPRTAATPGRGGARYSTFIYAEGKPDPPLTIAGPVDADTYLLGADHVLSEARGASGGGAQGAARLPSASTIGSISGVPSHHKMPSQTRPPDTETQTRYRMRSCSP